MWDRKNITEKFYNQNYRSSPTSSQNFYRNDRVVSENEQFKVGRKFLEIFSEIFGNIYHIFLEIVILRNHQIFLKISYRVLVGALTGFGRI